MRRLFPVSRQRREREIQEEVESHLQMAIRDRIDRGESPDDARFAAQREFGNLHVVRDTTRAVWSGVALEQLLQDLRFGARILTKAPGLSATAVLLTALVIGGNTTIFSMVHALTAKPAAGVSADRLVMLTVAGKPGAGLYSYPEFLDYMSQASALQPLVAFTHWRFNVTSAQGTVVKRGILTSPGYFESLNVRLVLGRGFSEAEHHARDGLVAVISYRTWQDDFRGTHDVIGQSIVLDGIPARIVGVAPPRFRGALLQDLTDVWVPLLSNYRVRADEATLMDRKFQTLGLMGRLAPHLTFDQAETQVDTVSQRLQSAFPETNKNKTAVVVPYSMTAGSVFSDRVPLFMSIFSIVTLLTVLIVSANVANLLLARALARRRETAVRQSLGASRLRIVRMLVAEGLAISTAAWLAACVFAFIVSKAVTRLLPPNAQGASLDPDFTPDWNVTAYAMALAALATLAFMIAPALRAWRQDMLSPLKAGDQTVAQGRSRISNMLVVAQLAFTVVLLTSAGLAYRSISLIQDLDVGFDKRNLLLVTVDASSAPTRDANLALLGKLRDRLHSMPGVTSVSYVRRPPRMLPAEYPVRTTLAQDPVMVRRTFIGPDYLQVLGLQPTAGRDTVPDEWRSSKGVALVNQYLAQALWPDRTPIGETLVIGPLFGDREQRVVEVVGVSPNALFEGFANEARPYHLLLPDEQVSTPANAPTFYVRHTQRLDTLAPAIRRAVRDADASVPVLQMQTMETQIASMAQPFHLVTMLLAIFAAISLVIAAIGQYAVIAFDTRRRTREFGVRLALGASASRILGSVVRQGSALTLGGLACGFALSAAAGGLFGRLLYGVSPTDVLTYLGVFGLLAAVSLLACYVPARRAAGISPVEALRQE